MGGEEQPVKYDPVSLQKLYNKMQKYTEHYVTPKPKPNQSWDSADGQQILADIVKYKSMYEHKYMPYGDGLTLKQKSYNVTGDNIGAIVREIHVEEDKSFYAFKISLRLRDDTTFYFVVHKNVWGGPHVDSRDLIARELNRAFKQKPMSAHLQFLLMDFEDAAFYSKKSNHATYWKPIPGYHETTKSTVPTGRKIVAELTAICPSLTKTMNCPACRRELGVDVSFSLKNLVQHLNDNLHQWSREQIADWLETLDIDLDFKVPEEDPALF